MIEDKLTQDERRRLEALSQAIMFATNRTYKTNEIVSIASTFETFIMNGKTPPTKEQEWY